LGELTIVMLIIISIISWLIGKDVIQKLNPVSYQQSLFSDRIPIINMNTSIAPLAVSISSWDGRMLRDDRIFKFDIIQYRFDYSETEGSYILTNATTIEMELCKHSHFPQLTEEEMGTVTIASCPKDNANMSLYGYWTEKSMSYIEMRLSICGGDNCAPREEIVSYINTNKISVNLFTLQPMIDNTDFEKPIKWDMHLKYIYANTQMNKFIEFGLQRNFIRTDVGYLLEDVKNEEFHELKVTVPTDPMEFDPVEKSLVFFQFYSTRQFTEYYRKYIKIPEIIASIGGILNISMIVLA
jgi:hypothetical protein